MIFKFGKQWKRKELKPGRKIHKKFTNVKRKRRKEMLLPEECKMKSGNLTQETITKPAPLHCLKTTHYPCRRKKKQTLPFSVMNQPSRESV